MQDILNHNLFSSFQ